MTMRTRSSSRGGARFASIPSAMKLSGAIRSSCTRRSRAPSCGGVGPGVSPKTALAVGLKVDVDALPASLIDALKNGQVNLDDPATTLALLKLNAVVGVTGFFNKQRHAALGRHPVRALPLDRGQLVRAGHRPSARRLGQPRSECRRNHRARRPICSPWPTCCRSMSRPCARSSTSWGPGKFDAELFLDGKAFRPDGKTAATLIPPAFGLAGVNLHTWTGWGSVTYWNAFVANLEMHGQGTFYDPRLNDAEPVPGRRARAGFGNVRNEPDLITPKLAGAARSISSRSRRPRRRRAASTGRRPRAARRSSTARRSAPAAMSRRCSPSRAGTCTRRRRSASTTSRPTARPTTATAPRR